MMNFSWRCPFCNHDVTIGEENYSVNEFHFCDNNQHGHQLIITEVITCPNPECKEYSLKLSIYDGKLDEFRQFRAESRPKKTWQLIPEAETKIFPEYVPAPIISDYQEACLIKDLSPKASATLARRCLQGMIRDFWGIQKDRLIDEIKAIEDKVDPKTWQAIDAVRKIGNIGAHMEKDINLIVDVEPGEAKLLIGLIETLINDWYIVKHNREESMKQIIDLAKNKKNNSTK